MLLLWISLITPCVVVSQHPHVFIPSMGVIVGTQRETVFQKRPVYAFLGVNYALSPSEKRRFWPPQPFEWDISQEYNATLFRQPCPQTIVPYYKQLPPEMFLKTEDSEDCLVVNVYTPKIPKSASELLLPVLFYIHGGSFYGGSAQDFVPEFLLERDVILVVPQYRLGILGFSSLQTDLIPGNAGALDILFALEWVKKNIKWFGGDASQITVAGQSAGAAAVSSLLVSPMVKPGLFSKLIVQSGSVDSNWAVSSDLPQALRTMAQSANCFSSDSQEIADCLRKTPVDVLLNAHDLYMHSAGVGESTKAAALTVQTAGTHKFLEKDPLLSFDDNEFLKMPVMVGTTRDDGGAFLADLFSQVTVETKFNRSVTKMVLKCLTSKQQPTPVVDFYHNKYFSEIKTVGEAIRPLYDLFSVFTMKAPTLEIARRMRTFNPTYVYSFYYLGNISKLGQSEPDWDKLLPFPIGVAHSDELGYLYPVWGHNYSQEELNMVKTMVELWTNFIIYGNPSHNTNIKWAPMNDDFGPYLRIKEVPSEEKNFFVEYEVATRDGFATRTSAAHLSMASFIIITCTLSFHYL